MKFVLGKATIKKMIICSCDTTWRRVLPEKRRLVCLTRSDELPTDSVHMMSEYNNFYGSYWWIDNKKDTWFKIMLMTAPLLIVCGIALIAHRIYSRRSSARVPKPCSNLRAHLYERIYDPTTYPFDDAMWENALVADKLIALEDITGHDVPDQQEEKEEEKEQEIEEQQHLLLAFDSASVI